MRSVTIVLVELLLLSMVYAVTVSPATSAGGSNTSSAAPQPAASNATANATSSETAKTDNTSGNATVTPGKEGATETTSSNAIEVTCTVSNEKCSVDSECCSKRCVQLHSGADYRCLKSSVDKTCKHDYNCIGRLECSTRKQCCVTLWQSCVTATQCCNPLHRCLSMPGFIYKKCLFSEAICIAPDWGLSTVLFLLAKTTVMVLLL
ncbi:uncharacterized protein LOC124111080 isoform X4 [Haliotis rufescens]|uniref:uncharacterized protein LOC124111080 isoform X4 n=1 Tax=Haliotis rufescens TaxID=6454 RepID=UPI001EB037D9|nr:uncharacterized protein LOC124111080 isoform X4 [Haliotis rufescens]